MDSFISYWAATFKCRGKYLAQIRVFFAAILIRSSRGRDWIDLSAMPMFRCYNQECPGYKATMQCAESFDMANQQSIEPTNIDLSHEPPNVTTSPHVRFVCASFPRSM